MVMYVQDYSSRNRNLVNSNIQMEHVGDGADTKVDKDYQIEKNHKDPFNNTEKTKESFFKANKKGIVLGILAVVIIVFFVIILRMIV